MMHKNVLPQTVLYFIMRVTSTMSSLPLSNVMTLGPGYLGSQVYNIRSLGRYLIDL